jgi:hypothetical protein
MDCLFLIAQFSLRECIFEHSSYRDWQAAETGQGSEPSYAPYKTEDHGVRDRCASILKGDLLGNDPEKGHKTIDVRGHQVRLKELLVGTKLIAKNPIEVWRAMLCCHHDELDSFGIVADGECALNEVVEFRVTKVEEATARLKATLPFFDRSEKQSPKDVADSRRLPLGGHLDIDRSRSSGWQPSNDDLVFGPQCA